MKFEIYLTQCPIGEWRAGCKELNIEVLEKTPRQAIVSVANKLRRIKKDQLEGLI